MNTCFFTTGSKHPGDLFTGDDVAAHPEDLLYQRDELDRKGADVRLLHNQGATLFDHPEEFLQGQQRGGREFDSRAEKTRSQKTT